MWTFITFSSHWCRMTDSKMAAAVHTNSALNTSYYWAVSLKALSPTEEETQLHILQEKKKRERESEQEAEHRTVRLHLKEQTGWKEGIWAKTWKKDSCVNHRGARVKMLQRGKRHMQRLTYSWTVCTSVIVTRQTDDTDRDRHILQAIIKAGYATQLAVLIFPIIFCIFFFLCLRQSLFV